MKCNNCGTTNTPQAKACANCGLPLESGEASRARPTAANAAGGSRILPLAVGIAVAGGVAWVVMQQLPSEPEAPATNTEVNAAAATALPATAEPTTNQSPEALAVAPSGAVVPSAAATGEVELAEPEEESQLPREVIQRVIRQQLGEIRKCYEHGLQRNSKLAGTVSVRFVIGNDGRVILASAEDTGFPDQGVIQCVLRHFRGMSFPASKGHPTIITYPVKFAPG